MATIKNTLTCQECTAELEIKVFNDEDLNSSDIKFCPCCGRKTEISIVDDDDDIEVNFDDWDDQDHNNF